jgi:small-conductance mechanosensitive channel
MQNLTTALERAATASFDAVVGNLPQVLGALALLLLGSLAAVVLRFAARRGAALLDTVVARSTGQARWRPGRSGEVLGAVVFWVVLLFFVTAATQTLGLRTFTDWLSKVLDHLPTLAAGLLIVVAGYVLSGFVGDLVRATATALAPAQRLALARLAQGATLVAALLVGADQIGLKVTWVAVLAAVAVAAVLGAAALAVSLGARGYVANLIGAFYLRQALQPGQRVRVGGHEGRIVEITATSLVLETPDGRVLLPARVYHDEAIVVHARAESDGI